MAEEVVETDLLVVGGGCAGCWAALRASDFTPNVVLVDKGVVARSGTTLFCHDMLGPAPEDELEAWLKEMAEHTEYLCDQEYGLILLREQRERVKDLERWGLPFERDAEGRLFLSLGRGHKVSRGILCDFRRLMETLREKLIEKGVRLKERVMVTDLLTSDGQHPTTGRVTGAVGINTRSGDFVLFKAKAVMLATGVISTKLHAAYADNLTGDGQAMALRAGAKLGNLEFIFGPRFAGVHKGRLIITSLMPFQTQGAYIVNRLGDRFVESYAPERGERRSGMGLLAQAACKEILEGRGPLYFDMRHFGAEKLAQLMRVLPLRLGAIYEAGIDPAKELIECKPLILHFGTGGGIQIGLNGQTSLPGLFAGGIGCLFPGASELLSGATLAVCNVFGYRAGESAAKLAKELEGVEPVPEQLRRLKETALGPLARKEGIKPAQLYHRLDRKLVHPQYSIFKSEQSIKEMLGEIKEAQQEVSRLYASDGHELVKANEARNFVELLEGIFLAALERKETRLAHYRVDYPYRDDKDWLKWVLVARDDNGINICCEPVPLGKGPVPPPLEKKYPAQVQPSGVL